MMKPIHPRNRGKEPQSVFLKQDRIYLRSLPERTLEKLVEAWGVTLKEHQSQGHRVVGSPTLECELYESNNIYLSYTYEWNNPTYAEEKAQWDEAAAQYEIDLAAWKERESECGNDSNNIDAKIVRAQHRLANLLATKEGKPIPYPYG